MALLPVLKDPDPRLREVSKLVEKFDDELKEFMASLLETMYHEQGIGIAAVQVGKLEERVILDEGCLSVRDADDSFVKGLVERPKSVTVEYQDLNGKSHILVVDGNNSNHELWLARCLQHELDHLNGKLFTEHVLAQ